MVLRIYLQNEAMFEFKYLFAHISRAVNRAQLAQCLAVAGEVLIKNLLSRMVANYVPRMCKHLIMSK